MYITNDVIPSKNKESRVATTGPNFGNHQDEKTLTIIPINDAIENKYEPFAVSIPKSLSIEG